MTAPESQLWTAVRMGDQKSVRTLLHDGVSVNARGKQGWTALMIAASKGNREMVTILLAAGANTEPRDQLGKTASDYAEEGGFTNIASLLRTR